MELLDSSRLFLRICGVLLIISAVRCENYVQFLPPEGKLTVFTDKTKQSVVLEMVQQPSMHLLEDLTANAVEGYIMISDPPDACESLSAPPNISLPLNRVKEIEVKHGWILLADKLGCNYMTKVENAFHAGYVAILISNVGSNRTEAIGSGMKFDAKLEAFFIGEEDGKILRENFSYPTKHFVLIDRPEIYFAELTYSVYWAVIIIFAVLVLVGACYSISVKCGWKDPIYEKCKICRTEMRPVENNVLMSRFHTLPCEHRFHSICTFPYTSRGGMTCPCCRRFFRFDAGERELLEGGSGRPITPAMDDIQPTPPLLFPERSNQNLLLNPPELINNPLKSNDGDENILE